MNDLQLNQSMLMGLKTIYGELQKQTFLLQRQEERLHKLQDKVNQLYTLLALVMVVIPVICGCLFVIAGSSGY